MQLRYCLLECAHFGPTQPTKSTTCICFEKDAGEELGVWDISESAHLQTQLNMCLPSSALVAQCPRAVAIVLRCHPRLPKPCRHSASSAKAVAAEVLRVYSSVILPTLLLELKCTALLEPEIHHLQILVMHCHHTILSISSWNNKRSISMRRQPGSNKYPLSNPNATTLCKIFALHAWQPSPPQAACLFSALWQTLCRWPQVQIE